MKAYIKIWLFLAYTALACGGQSGLQGNSETHFLGYCSEACAKGLSCICGVCTVTCNPAATCSALDQSAICRSPEDSDSLSCGEASQPSVCDVPCDQDGDCASLSQSHRCQEGFCRLLDSGCLYMGQLIPAGGTIPAPGSQTCNTCSCSQDGQVTCTRAACATCEYGGQTYGLGDSFPSEDGCNMCSCEGENAVVCSMRACTSSGGGTGGSGGTSATSTTSTTSTASTTTQGTTSSSTTGSGGSDGNCYSPTQNLDTAYNGGTGCECVADDHDRCIEGVSLECMDNGRWLAVEDGPCFPSICNQPLEIDNTCDIAEHVGYWHNAATGQCEPYAGGCPMNDNAFLSLDACVESCQDKASLAAVVEWSSCEGLGQQISQAGDEGTFSREGNVISKELFWGCGCATRSEFVMAYEPSSPLRLRLCHDEAADPCEAGCMDQVGFNLSEAFAAANTDDFVFVD